MNPLQRPFKCESNLCLSLLKITYWHIIVFKTFSWIIKTWEVWLHLVFLGLSRAPFACLIPEQQCHALLLSDALPVCLLLSAPSASPTGRTPFGCRLVATSCPTHVLGGKSTPRPSEKAMVPHSSTVAWKIPWMEEPGGLQSMRSLRVGHD